MSEGNETPRISLTLAEEMLETALGKLVLAPKSDDTIAAINGMLKRHVFENNIKVDFEPITSTDQVGDVFRKIVEARHTQRNPVAIDSLVSRPVPTVLPTTYPSDVISGGATESDAIRGSAGNDTVSNRWSDRVSEGRAVTPPAAPVAPSSDAPGLSPEEIKRQSELIVRKCVELSRPREDGGIQLTRKLENGLFAPAALDMAQYLPPDHSGPVINVKDVVVLGQPVQEWCEKSNYYFITDRHRHTTDKDFHESYIEYASKVMPLLREHEPEKKLIRPAVSVFFAKPREGFSRSGSG